MVNYANSKIYKIVGGGLTYIGSTTRPLSERFYEHKRKTSCSSRFVLEHLDACVVLIENYPCENKEQLFARERHWVDTLKCVNLLRPMRYEGETQEIDKQYNKAYYEANRDKHKEYYEANRDKILECREANKEQKSLYDKEYRESNKEKIALQRKLKRQNKMSL